MSTNSSSLDQSKSLPQLPIQDIGHDVTIQIGDRTFNAHKAILMAKMKFFHDMFTTDTCDNVNDNDNADKNPTVISLDPEIVHPDAFATILVYTTKSMSKSESKSKIDLNQVDLRALYKAANYFNFKDLMRKIEVFMKMHMKTMFNAILYKRIAVEFNLKYLEDDCHKCIIRYLSSNIDRDFVSLLSYEELIDILEKLRKLSRCEDMFYYAIEWVNIKNDRKCQLIRLLKNIPLESLSFTFLKEVVSKCSIILNDNDSLRLLFEVMINKPRLEERIYAIGGVHYRVFLSTVSEYNSLTQEWTCTTPMPSPRSRFGIAVIDQRIYVCGGFDGIQETNELTVFENRKWTKLKPMNHPRSSCGMAELDGQIYVAGGSIGNDKLAVVERYCPVTDQWSEVASLPTKRTGLELVALNGYLYAIGGRDDVRSLDSVDRYDPQTDQWSVMNSTNNVYWMFGSAVLNGHIYIAGEDTCEVYDSAKDRWIEMPRPVKCDGARRLAVLDEKLYAIGGAVGHWKDRKGSKRVEVFDFEARVWRPEPDMDVERGFHGVAVVRN